MYFMPDFLFSNSTQKILPLCFNYKYHQSDVLYQQFLKCDLVLGPTLSISSGNLVEMHILGPHPCLLTQKLWIWGPAVCLNKPSKVIPMQAKV